MLRHMSDLRTYKVRDERRLTEATSLGAFPGLQRIRHSQRFCRCTVRVAFGRSHAPTCLLLRPQSLVCWRPTGVRINCFRHLGRPESLVSNGCCLLILFTVAWILRCKPQRRMALNQHGKNYMFSEPTEFSKGANCWVRFAVCVLV